MSAESGTHPQRVPKAGPITKFKGLAPGEILLKGANSSLKSSSSRFLNVGPQVQLERLPQLKSLPPSEQEHMFVEKVNQCKVVFDFTKAINLAEAEQKEIKRECLLELVEFLLTEKIQFSPEMYKAVIDMIRVNLFRPLPPRLNPRGEMFDPDDDEPILEAAWPHVQIIYEFFLRFVESPEFDSNVAKSYLTRKFVNNMLDLFGSEDPRERDYLKTTLHRIYGKFLSLRSYIRRQIKNVFFTFTYEMEVHYGIAELLEILGSIINGFTLPLKQEHKDFLSQALIPLHKPRSLSTYHPQLSYCLAQYIEKDPLLTDELFKKIFQFWPVTNSSKQLLFLNEVEEILCVVEPDMFVVIQEPLFKKISTCISSTHFQISEKALTLWNNEYILSLVAENVEVVLPVVFPALYYVARSHWNKAIRSMAYTSLRLFMDIDEIVFGQVIEQYSEERAKEVEARELRVTKWRQLFEMVEPEKLRPRRVVDPALAGIPEGEASEAPPNPSDNPHLPPEIPAHLDPLLNDNEGLPLSVKIPFHLNQLVADDFDKSDPVFQELNELHTLQLNKALRHRQMLPMDSLAVEALQGHVSLDDLEGDYDNYDSDSSSYSSYDSDEYTDESEEGYAVGYEQQQ
eukprot:TRINITY_DN2142_c0_g1_i1.p1 TRINITY_DN2142_c0_g1~~TRINITY_DN2142_c0_g1_i1.p1  ORF type:complete len:638 (+),score=168.28 TRINITY_DN2142_c0_g1_i1:38-1915(+)